MMKATKKPAKDSSRSYFKPKESRFQPRPFASPAKGDEAPVSRGSGFRFNLADIDIFSRETVQPKLKLGPVGDRYEREADRVARRVVETISSSKQSSKQGTVQSQEDLEDEEELDLEEDEELQRKVAVSAAADGADVGPDLESAIRGARGQGQLLSDGVRQPMERAFGADFGGVRVHADGQADSLNRSIQARAFTTGQDIFLGKGEYRPESSEGQRLLAHELTHVVQQGNKTSTNKIQRDWDWARAGIGALIGGVGGAVAGGLVGGLPGALIGAGVGFVAGGLMGGLTAPATPATPKHIKPNFVLDKKVDPRSNTKSSTQSKSTPTFVGKVVGDGKVWRYELTSVESKGKIRIVYYTKDHYPAPTPTDDSGVLSNVKKRNWKAIVKDLKKNKAGIADFWSAYRAEDVHENYHWVVEWQGEMKKELVKAENAIAALSVGVDKAPTATDAEKVLLPKVTKLFNDAMKRADNSYQALPDSPGDPPYKAQIPVVDALKDRVIEHAKANKW